MKKHENRKRPHRVQVRLNDKEYEHFCAAVKRSKLTKEAYLRHLINGYVPQDAPPPDYFSMMQQLYRIGNNLNQIARKAHVLWVVDVQQYNEAYRELERAIIRITEAVILPRKL